MKVDSSSLQNINHHSSKVVVGELVKWSFGHAQHDVIGRALFLHGGNDTFFKAIDAFASRFPTSIRQQLAREVPT